MSIRPDTWIAKMAKEQRMIEPFVQDQVRSIDGRPVISFGNSSFGYDLRVGDPPQHHSSRGLSACRQPELVTELVSRCPAVTFYRAPGDLFTTCKPHFQPKYAHAVLCQYGLCGDDRLPKLDVGGLYTNNRIAAPPPTS